MNVCRGVPTGIYATNKPEACHFVADNCKANIIVVEDQKQLNKILEVSIVLIVPDLRMCICICVVTLMSV